MRFWVLSKVQAFALSFFVILPSLLSAQARKTKVMVYEKGTGHPLSKAEIRISSHSYLTDRQGAAIIEIPFEPKVQDKIAILRFGYDKLIVGLDELPQEEPIEFYLTPATPPDNLIRIRGKKRPAPSKKRITGQEAVRAAPGGDPAQVTNLLPGVQKAPLGRQEVAIRGSGPEDSRYFIDHFVVRNVFHPVGNISVVPPQIIDAVDFYAGGFGPEYGDATGGVIVLQTKDQPPDRKSTELRVNLPFYSAVYHEQPLTDHSAIIGSVRYSYLQYLLQAFLPKDANATIVPYFSDAHAVYLNKNPKGEHSKTMMFGSQDGVELVVPTDFSANEDGTSEISFRSRFMSLGHEQQFLLGQGRSLVVVPQFYYEDMRNRFLEDYFRWDVSSVRLFAEWSQRVTKQNYWRLGWSAHYDRARLNFRIPQWSKDPLFDFEEAPRIEQKKTVSQWQQSAWMSYDYGIGLAILTPGIRVSYGSVLKQALIDPRLLARLKLSEMHTLKWAIGQYSKKPQYMESDTEFGNPELRPQNSIHYILGLESHWQDKWDTDIQLYYKKTIRVVFPDTQDRYHDLGQRRSYGLELFVRRNLTKRMFGWLSYTYSRTDEKEDAHSPWRAAEFDQNHVVSFTGSYRLTAQWDLGSRISYHTGDTYDLVTDRVYNAQLDKYQPRKIEKNAGRLPDYQQIDVYAIRDFLYNQWKMTLHFGLMYLAFKKQVYARSYNYDYTETQDFDSLPPIPFLELRGAF